MPDDQTKIIADRFGEMADSWTIFAQSAYRDWASMKYQRRKTPDGPGHRSQKEFENFKIGVYKAHKLYKENAKLCLVVAKLVMMGELGEMQIEREGVFEGTKRIISNNFKLLKP